MALKIKVYSDYVCPFCFLAKIPFDEATAGKDVEVEWMPFELRPAPSPQLDPVNDPHKRAGWESYIAPTAKKWGVTMKLPDVSPHPYTHLAHEGFQYAKEHGKAKQYNHRVFTSFFQDEQDIGNVDVLTKIAGEIGLDEAEFREALVTRKYKEKHRRELEHAYGEARITAVPTFIIGDERIQGAAGKEVFDKVIEQQLAKQAGAAMTGMACDADGNLC